MHDSRAAVAPTFALILFSVLLLAAFTPTWRIGKRAGERVNAAPGGAIPHDAGVADDF